MVRIKDALYRVTFLATFSILFSSSALGAGLLIPMDGTQSNHLKAYGVTYWALQAPRVYKSEWLLNYRGGSFLILDNPDHVYKQATLMGVTSQIISDSDIEQIHQEIESENMEAIPLERAPKVAVYTPPTNDPDDAALALTRRNTPMKRSGTGKCFPESYTNMTGCICITRISRAHGKFYAAAYTQPRIRKRCEISGGGAQADIVKYSSTRGCCPKLKLYRSGWTSFAMCSSPTLDIALAALGVDIIAPEIDGDGITPGFEDT